mmetsp:Transcript_71290/g.127052  ORF Transcript_71290/g.127052 Transcript_71290/m.127052 type:complete len:567 (+) Transcript_71290:31-1731(+)
MSSSQASRGMLDFQFADVLAEQLQQLHQLLITQHDRAVWDLQCRVAELEGKPVPLLPVSPRPQGVIVSPPQEQDASHAEKPQAQSNEGACMEGGTYGLRRLEELVDYTTSKKQSDNSSPDFEAEAEPEAESMDDDNALPRGMDSRPAHVQDALSGSVSTQNSMPELIPLQQARPKDQHSSLLIRVKEISQRYSSASAHLQRLEAKHSALDVARMQAEIVEQEAHEAFSSVEAPLKSKQQANQALAQVEEPATIKAEDCAHLKAEIELNRIAWMTMQEEMIRLQAELQVERIPLPHAEVAVQCSIQASADDSKQALGPFSSGDGKAETEVATQTPVEVLAVKQNTVQTDWVEAESQSKGVDEGFQTEQNGCDTGVQTDLAEAESQSQGIDEQSQTEQNGCDTGAQTHTDKADASAQTDKKKIEEQMDEEPKFSVGIDCATQTILSLASGVAKRPAGQSNSPGSTSSTRGLRKKMSPPVSPAQVAQLPSFPVEQSIRASIQQSSSPKSTPPSTPPAPQSHDMAVVAQSPKAAEAVNPDAVPISCFLPASCLMSPRESRATLHPSWKPG